MTKANRKRIKLLLVQYDITQRDLANIINIEYHSLNKTILGKTSNEVIRKKITYYFKVPYKSLWGVDEPGKRI